MRIKRIAVMIIIVTVASVIGPSTQSFAHPITRFEACAARTRTSETCLRRERYTLNQTVFLRARVSPAHAGFLPGVLRLDPGSNVWMRVDAVPISDRGGVRWRWKTTFQDADRNRPYRFKFVIRRHRESNDVRVWVLFRDQHLRPAPDRA
jgi:hypothetical protein